MFIFYRYTDTFQMSEEDIEEEEVQKPAKTRSKGRVIAPAGVSPAQISEQMMEAPVVPPEVRDRLTGIMQELLVKTHELSFEYSTMECEKITECPLACKSKELFKTVKQLNELMKEVTPTQQPAPKPQPKP